MHSTDDTENRTNVKVAPYARSAASNPMLKQLLGNKRVTQQVDVSNTLGGARATLLRCLVLAIGPENEMAKKVRRWPVIIANVAPAEVTGIASIGRGGDAVDFEVLNDDCGKLVRNGRALLAQRVKVNLDEARYNRDNNIKKSASRTESTPCELMPGSYVNAVLGPKIYESNGVGTPPPGGIFTVDVSEIQHDNFDGGNRTSFQVCAYTRLEHMAELSGSACNTLLGAVYHSNQMVLEMVPLLLNPEEFPHQPTKDELKKLKNASFLPESHYMRGTHTIAIMCGPSEAATGRVQRGLNATIMSDPIWSVEANGAGFWPVEEKKSGSAPTRLDMFKVEVECTQYIRREPLARIELPVAPEKVNEVFRVRRFNIRLTVWRESLRAFGVIDDRDWYSTEYHISPLRNLIVATPFITRAYLDSTCARLSPLRHEDDQFTLAFVDSGTPKKDNPDGHAEATATFAFVAHGVVNAGYPVSYDRMLDLVDWMAKKNPDVYAREMSSVISKRRLVDKKTMPSNYFNTLSNTNVYNLLEYNGKIDALDKDKWMFFVIPNVGPKGMIYDNDGNPPYRTPAFQYYCDKVQELHTKGDELAADHMGRVFLALLNSAYANIPDVFHMPPGTSRFAFLLFAVSRTFMKEAGISPTSCQNHVDTILPKYVEAYYPSDLSDIADEIHAYHAAVAAADKKAATKEEEGYGLIGAEGDEEEGGGGVVVDDKDMDDAQFDATVRAAQDRKRSGGGSKALSKSKRSRTIKEDTEKDDGENGGDGGELF
jgi:hypothetical protein